MVYMILVNVLGSLLRPGKCIIYHGFAKYGLLSSNSFQSNSGPKDVVLVLDVSGSMENYGRLELAKKSSYHSHRNSHRG